MEGHCLAGQSPQWAVVPMEEEEVKSEPFNYRLPVYRDLYMKYPEIMIRKLMDLPVINFIDTLSPFIICFTNYLCRLNNNSRENNGHFKTEQKS